MPTVPVDPSDPKSVKRRPSSDDLFNVARGFAMGAADTVPGVSGGTIALILGHYKRLITAISHVDGTTLRMVRRGQIRAAAERLDLRFLITLLSGILLGVILLAGVMHHLLDHHMPMTLAAFFGFLLASVWIVKDAVVSWRWSRWLAMSLGVAVAIAITLLPQTNAELSAVYLFIAASVAICAMILPGISGAFILLLFGVYHPVTGLIKDTAKLNVTTQSLVYLSIFAGGCLFGLLAFSRLLKHLLTHHHDLTMSALVGLMLGSIGKLYPLQRPTAETASLESKYRIHQAYWPGEWPDPVWPLIAIAVFSAVSILIVERQFAGNEEPV